MDGNSQTTSLSATFLDQFGATPSRSMPISGELFPSARFIPSLSLEAVAAVGGAGPLSNLRHTFSSKTNYDAFPHSASVFFLCWIVVFSVHCLLADCCVPDLSCLFFFWSRQFSSDDYYPLLMATCPGTSDSEKCSSAFQASIDAASVGV